MPWNEVDRAKYEVIRARYSSDMSEAELALVAPLLPPPKLLPANRQEVLSYSPLVGQFPG